MNIIELVDLKKNYGKEEVLFIPSFSFLFGKSYLLIGGNGSGKSTLLRLILGLSEVSGGKVIKNYDKASYVPERFIFPEILRVNQFLALICKLNGSEHKLGLIKDFAKQWKIDENKEIYKLSKGNKQKVLIAQALLTDCKLFVFDEALNGLDLNMQEMLISEISKLTKMGKTVIIATHYAKAFSGNVDYYIELREGNLYFV